jgi:acylphosphatase
MKDMRRVLLRVSGRVQGVCYRAETRRAARGLGLVGHVRNLDDGDVEVLAEGAPEAIAALIAWCRKGPPHALVTDVDVVEEPPAGGGTSFDIRY